MDAAERRLHNHQAWQHHENERRLAAKTAQAEHAAESALSQSGAEGPAVRAAEATRPARSSGRRTSVPGPDPGCFDGRCRTSYRRAGSSTSSCTPRAPVPVLLPAPRATWSMPPNVSSVNLPRFTVGARAGVQVGDGNALARHRGPGRRLRLGASVLTLAVQLDVSMQRSTSPRSRRRHVRRRHRRGVHDAPGRAAAPPPVLGGPAPRRHPRRRVHRGEHGVAVRHEQHRLPVVVQRRGRTPGIAVSRTRCSPAVRQDRPRPGGLRQPLGRHPRRCGR